MTILARWLLPLLSLGFPLVSHAADTPTVRALTVKEKHYMNDAIKLEVTPRGQEYFQNQMDDILNNMGVSLDEAYFADIHWKSTKSYDLDNLPFPAKTKRLIATIHDALKSWFIGLSLSNVKPAMEIGNSGYQAVFNKIAISTDENLLHRLGKTDGAVLVVEVDIKELDVVASKVRAWDQNNPDYGQVGFNDVKIKVAGGKVPLQIRMPFYVSLNSQGIPSFEAVNVQDNVDKIDMELNYGKLIVPQIQLVINGKVMPFNEAKLENDFIQNVPAMLLAIRRYVHDFAAKQVPQLLNDKAKQYLVHALEEIKPMSAPGAAPGSANEYLWGLQLKGISEKNGLIVDMNTFVEDPLNPNSLPKAFSAAPQPALMNALPGTVYDIGLSLDEGMINRMLQLSFERHLFSKVAIKGSSDAGDGGYLQLTQAPVLRPVSNFQFNGGASAHIPGETFARLDLAVIVPKGTVSGKNKLFLQDQFAVKMSMIVKIAKTANGKALAIYLWDVDPDSIIVDSDNITGLGKFFSGTVLDSLKSQFAEKAATWRTTGVSIPGSIPVPAILGVSLDVYDLVMEPTGHLVLYLNYATNTAKQGANP